MRQCISPAATLQLTGHFCSMSAKSEPSSRAIVILVAEDDMLTRWMAVDALTDAGFNVINVAHAADALSVLALRADQIQALFTDIHMPGGMTGLELAHHVRSHWPWIALLVASGNWRPAPEAMPVGSRFLSKPYDPSHVVKHIRELVQAG